MSVAIKKGYTLLELLIALSIFILLIGTVLYLIRPRLIVDKAEDNVRAQDVQTIAEAIRFKQLKDGRFPFTFPHKTEGWAVGSDTTFIYYDGAEWNSWDNLIQECITMRMPKSLGGTCQNTPDCIANPGTLDCIPVNPIPNHPHVQNCLDNPYASGPPHNGSCTRTQDCLDNPGDPTFCLPAGLTLNTIQVNSPVDVWAGSNISGIWHYDGYEWTVQWGGNGMNSWNVLAAMYFVSPNKGWVGGGLYEIGEWDGEQWNNVFNRNDLYAQLTDMGMSPEDVSLRCEEYGAVDEFDETYRWDGFKPWPEPLPEPSQPTHPTTPHWHCGGFTDIQMLSASDGWAVAGRGIIAQYDGTKWTLDPSVLNLTEDDTMWNLSMISPTEGWASGHSLYRYLNGIWTDVGLPFGLPTSVATKGLEAFAQDDVWFSINTGAGSANKRVFKFDGTDWIDAGAGYTGVANTGIRRFAREDDDTLFGVNADGEVWMYDNVSWTRAEGPPTLPDVHLNGLYVVSTSDSWISMLVEHDGGAEMTSGCTVNNDHCDVNVSDDTFCIDASPLLAEGLLSELPVSPPGNVIWDRGNDPGDNGTGYTIQKNGSTIIIRSCESERTDKIELFN